jgi:hypothetical protein
MGPGLLGKVAEQLSREDREERAQARAAEDEAIAKAMEAGRQSVSAFRDTELLASAAMLAAGFRQHKRQWRRRRAMKKNELAKASPKAPEPVPVPATWAEFKAMVQRLKEGDDTPIYAVRDAMGSGPDAAAKKDWFVYRFGMIYDQMEAAALKQFFNQNIAAREAMRLEMEGLRRELEGPHPSPLERLLVQSVVFSNWETWTWRTLMAQRSDVSDRTYLHWSKLLNAAHKRLLDATITLARVRRMALPELRLTVNQQNVGGQIAAPIVPQLTPGVPAADVDPSGP